MNQYTYQVFLISQENKATTRARMEGTVDFANPVDVGQHLEVTLGAKMPYGVSGVVVRVFNKGVARDCPPNHGGDIFSSLHLQTDLPSDKLNSYHERNGPHI